MLLKLYNIYKYESIYGIKFRLVKKFWSIKLKFYKLLNLKIVNSYYGIKLKANYDDVTFKFYVIGWYGNKYWKHLSSQKNPFIFLDVGANQGLYTLCAARNKNCITCVSFEPVSKTFNILNENVKINNQLNKCKLINKAISDKNGTSEIKIASNHSGAASMHTNNSFEDEIFYNKEIIETIDSIGINKLVDNDSKIRILVKVDVEGFEKTVLNELMQSKLASYIDEVFFEVDEKWVNYEEIQKFLKSKGFNSFIKTSDNLKHYDVYARKLN